MSDDQRGTILQHLRELRRRLFYSAIAVVTATGLSLAFYSQIFEILKRPAGDVDLIFIGLSEMIGTVFKVALYTGVGLALPFIVFQAVMFVAPALTPKEKRYAYLLIPAVFLFFATGVAFGYFVLLPPALRFLLTFGSDIATPQITVANYISTIVNLLFWVGVCFEIPMVMYFLAQLHILNPNLVARHRRLIVLVAFVVGAMITPTFDPLNQTLVSVPIVLLFELGIWLGRLAWRRAPK